MSIIKRVEVTFNESEIDLFLFLDSQKMANATFIKYLLYKTMNGENNIDYDHIRRIVSEVLAEQGVNCIPLAQKPNKQKQPSVFDGLAQKF